ncbi:hypothetical protein HU200_030939 [Digitaria exilis]|uniref:Uncharacterized protein n=1 Tax=Digitaria exilis TaxID=1010633 RepID=A0A835BW72_9POAL|nr:hypothetical protein HU200_030939 [Digitaria exilis]
MQMVCLVRWFHGGVVKENGEFENMKDVTRMFEVAPCLHEIVEYARSHFSCGVDDEISLKGRVDCGRGRATYAQMAHPRFPLLELAYDDTHRPHMIADQNMAWPFADSVPPYAYVWKNAEAVRGPPRRRYTAYTNEIDCLIGNQLSRIVNDAGVAMRHGNDARFLRSFVERVRRTCRRMALKLNCVTANPMDPARAPGGSSDSQPTPVHSAPGGSSAMAGPSSSHRAGKAPASPQASDEDEPGDDSEDSPAPGFAD